MSEQPTENRAPLSEGLPSLWISVFDTLRHMRKHWAVVAAVALSVSLGTTFYTLGAKSIYEASATVLFDPNPPRPLGKGIDTVVDMGAGNYWNNKDYYETQYRLMKTMRVALSVVRDLDLAHDASFLANAPPGARVPPRVASAEETAQILLDRISVDPVKNSRMAVLRYEDASPERAQRVASAVIDSYVALNLEDALASTNSAVEWLNGQLDKLRTGLDASEMALHEYKLSKNILSVDIDAQSNMLREEMKQLNEALTAARIREKELAARRDELMKVKADDPSALPASELLQSLVLQQLRTAYAEAVRDEQGLVAGGKGDSHPAVQTAKAKVRSASAALLVEVRNIQGAVERDLQVARKQGANLAGLYEASKRRALDLNLLEIEYNRLWRSKENNVKLYSLVLERSKESDLTRMLRVNNIRVVDRPLLPRRPVKPRVPLNIAIGVVSGMLLGIAAAFLRDFADWTIKTPADLETVTGLPFLGILPMVSAASHKPGYYGYGRRRARAQPPPDNVSPDLIVHTLPMSGPAEAARSIRTNIQFMSPDKPFRSLLVTSAGPAEGKTTVACCIAIAMAQAGQRVALVDCDLRRPRIHRIFGKTAEVGLTRALLDPPSLEAEMLETDVPNLKVLPSGPIPPNPSEILQSEVFETILRELAARFDRVVIDSPPIVPVTDAAIVATRTDGVVLVVRAFGTAKQLARQGTRTLRHVGGRIAGCVLNAVDVTKTDYKHYYYAYYRRSGYYYSDAESAQANRGNGANEATRAAS